MQKYKVKPGIIPNIQERIIQQLKDCGIRHKDYQEKINLAIIQKKHSFKSICQDYRGQKYFFKARLCNEELVHYTFRNDFINSRFFSGPKNAKYLSTHQPLKWNMSREFNWIIFDYIPGKKLMIDWNQDDIFEKITEIILNLQKIPVTILPQETKNFAYTFSHLFNPKINIQDSNFERISKKIKGYLENIEGELPAKEILDFVKSNQEILNQAEMVFCHGDPMMDNILISGDKIYLIDFEYTQVNLAPYDFVCLYHWAWDKSKWRQRLLKTIIPKIEKPAEFKIIFRIMIILQSLYHMCYYTDNKPSLFKISKEVFDFKKETIIQALKSYGAITKDF